MKGLDLFQIKENIHIGLLHFLWTLFVYLYVIQFTAQINK